MPRSAKKRKDKAADFTKAKLKIGREKKAPSNAIDTSFKARSIALPTQSITAIKDEGAPTTKRNLTFDELIGHLKHYSPTVRKDAIAGLMELLEAHWVLIGQHLSQLVNRIARIIGDEDAGVREQLLLFLSRLLPRLTKEDLIPHAPALLLFTASAQTHIFPEIRIDAMRFLTLFLERIPESVIEGWNSANPSHGMRILEGYLGNLNASAIYGDTESVMMTIPTTNVTLSPASKLAMMQSFSLFLRAGLTTDDRRNTMEDPREALHMWSGSDLFKRHPQSFESASAPIPRQPLPGIHPKLWSTMGRAKTEWDSYAQCYPLVDREAPWVTQELEEVVRCLRYPEEGTGEKGSTRTFLPRLARAVHPILVSTLLEYAPSVFAPDRQSSETEASIVVAVCQIVSLLYGSILGETPMAPASTTSELETFLGYLTPYFPFDPSGTRDSKFVQNAQDLNLMFCHLTSLLIFRLSSSPSKSGGHYQPARNEMPILKKSLMIQVINVSEYITKVVSGHSTTIPHSLNAGSYLALLPSIWAIISNSSPELSSCRAGVLQATLDHAIKAPSKSGLKRFTIEFVARLILPGGEPQSRGVFQHGIDDAVAQKFENWLTHFPQVLWEVGDSDLATTEVVLRFLLRLLQRRSPFIHSETIVAIQSRLVPYFIINHLVRGQLPGPYIKLPQGQPHLRQLCLDVISTVLAWGRRFGADASESCGALSTAVVLAVANTKEAAYWTHVREATASPC